MPAMPSSAAALRKSPASAQPFCHAVISPPAAEVLRGTGAPRRPVSNQERQDHKCEEEADRERVVRHREVLSFEVTKAGIEYPVRPQHIDEAEQER